MALKIFKYSPLKWILVVIMFSLTACTSTKHTFLVDPDLPISKRQQILESWKADYESAESIKENSSVGVGAWFSEYSKKRRVLTFAIKITNNSSKPIVTPDDLIIIDGENNSLKLLTPDDYVYYLEGETSEEAISQSTAMSIYASQLQQNQGVHGTMYSYGTTYGNNYSGFSTFSAQPVQSPPSSFASGFASGYAMGSAIKAARISREVREAIILALKPSTTLPNTNNIGRVWSLAGKVPVELHIFVGGDHHIIKLDRIIKEEH